MRLDLPWLEPAWQRVQRSRERGRMPHALLLTGPRGVGKRHFARALAAALLCAEPDRSGQACGHCTPCGWFAAGSHPDWLELEPEEPGKAIRIDAVRGLCQTLTLTGHVAGQDGVTRRVAAIRPADAMNVNAANSLLKTLEEPAPGTLLLLETAVPGRLPATIRSRCQPLALPLPATEQAWEWLARQGIEGAAARLVLELSGGAPLRALELHRDGAGERVPEAIERLEAVAAGREDPLALARDWNGEHEPLYLELWQTGVQALIRQRLMSDGNAGSRFDVAGHPLAQNLQSVLQTVDCKALYGFLDRLQNARDSGSSVLNRQLVLEDLLTRWAVLVPRVSKKRRTR